LLALNAHRAWTGKKGTRSSPDWMKVNSFVGGSKALSTRTNKGVRGTGGQGLEEKLQRDILRIEKTGKVPCQAKRCIRGEEGPRRDDEWEGLPKIRKKSGKRHNCTRKPDRYA